VNLKIVEALITHRGERIDRRLNRHRYLSSIRQPRGHRVELCQRDVARRFRMEDKAEVIGAAAIGKLRINDGCESTNLETNAVDHAGLLPRIALISADRPIAGRLFRKLFTLKI